MRLAIHKLTKKRVAVKTLTRAKLTDAKLRRRAEAEVKVHKLLRHAHIARLFEVISSQASINLCMQHAAGGTLRELLDQHGALPEARARRYLRQICGALHYCHEVVHVVHRDIKLDNMLLDANDNVLLADFGFAEVVGPNKRKLRLLCGSPHYSAPEIFAQQEYVGSQADMWSLGVLAYTLLAGHFPFQADTMDALGKKVRHGRWDRPLPSSTASSSSLRRSSSSARRSARRSPPSATTAGCSTAPPPPPTSSPSRASRRRGGTTRRRRSSTRWGARRRSCATTCRRARTTT